MVHQFEELLKFMENKLAEVFDAITGIHEKHNLPPEAKAEVETAIVTAKAEMAAAAQNTMASVSDANNQQVAEAAAKAVADAKAKVEADAAGEAPDTAKKAK